MNHPLPRLLGLGLLARFRHAGWPMVLGLVGWLLWVALQEPLVLRGHGHFLVRDGMQAAAVIAVFALLSLNLPMPGFPRQLSNLLVVVVFAVVQAVVPQLVGFCRGLVPEPGVAVGDAIGFLLIWVPPAFLLGARDGTHVFVNKILMIACVAIAIALSIHLRTDGISARAAVACALAWLVPFLLPASPRPGS